ncbi:hypothetical protein K450DRAFT_232712 [Umbelopsis ramanniana AG]|uniref:Galactose oxidase n=1 Tax=Umbelopsis ramanniana AG TaxID=1314678 RepID=A0AAD5EEC2_UMBRA|nr:uncharacterized protein K450DRAFT_232712 [Umbelopsis ramanniana AG]KAI8581366.1 hypothetical protein K450DRAFT_232712 [Umbelopsis ramanniana AG]
MLCQTYRPVLFLALSVIVRLAETSLAPSPRWGQAAAIVNNRFCFHGGKTGAIGVNETTAKNTNDLLLLNSIHSISTQSAPWALGSLDGPTTSYQSAVPGGQDNVYLIVYGGQPANGALNNTSNSTLYYYNTLTDSWFQPKVDSPSRRIEHTMTTNTDSGSAYLFGGYPLTNDLWSLDTIAMQWQQLPNQTFTPSPRYHHTTTLLADGRMVVVGGFDGNNTVNMTDIYTFDTNSLQWSYTKATGSIPASRRDHAATALPDGNSLLIHGGTNKQYTSFMSDIAILNCTTFDSCIWQTPPNPSPPAGRYAHTATLIDNFIIIAFGFTAKETGDSNIYIYDLKKFAWVKSYQPVTSVAPGPTSPSPVDTTTSSTSSTASATTVSDISSPPPSSPSPGTTAGVTIGSIAGVAAVGALIVVFYRRRKDRRNSSNPPSHFNRHNPSPAPSDISDNDTTPPQNRFSMIFSGRDSTNTQRYSWHPNQYTRPPTMVSSYARHNRASLLSHPGTMYNNQRYSVNNISNIFEAPEDFRGVDVGNSYFMPRKELFVVNADSDSKRSVTPY